MAKLLVDGLDLLLSDETMQAEMTFLDELLRWNQQINLTSIKNREDAIEKHLIDSLLLMPHLRNAKKIIDLGSGGGLPGIPLAIALPSIQVISVDSIGKKINFQRHIKRLLSLDNLNILKSRAENLDQTTLEGESFDVVIARAFAPLETILEYAAPWLKPGGMVIAMKGPGGDSEMKAAEVMVKQNKFVAPEVIAYNLPFSHAERQLLLLKKIAEPISLE